VTNVNDLPTGSVTIDNMSPTEGDTLTAANTLADADGLSGPISYQWYLDGVAIAGATGSSYTTVQADVGGVITVVASYTDDQGTFESVSSGATAPVVGLNNAPVITGDITGTVTEDEDPDSDGQLEVSGTLNIADPDTGESNFQAGTVNGQYGSLNIDMTGSWSYSVDNSLAAIQQLGAGERITDVVTVTTADGTTHNVTITIVGAEDLPIIDESPGPIDEGGTEPDPEVEDDPVEPDPEEIPLPEAVVPPIEEIDPQTLYSTSGPGVEQSNSNQIQRFGSTTMPRVTGVSYLKSAVSPTMTARYLSSIKREPAYGTMESRIEENFITAATVFFSPEVMAQALDHLQRQIDDTLELEAGQEQLVIGAAAGFGASVMVGYVLWAFRGSSLLLGALSAMPMWRSFDPLPVLLGSDKKSKEEDEKRVKELLDAE